MKVKSMVRPTNQPTDRCNLPLEGGSQIFAKHRFSGTETQFPGTENLFPGNENLFYGHFRTENEDVHTF